MNLSELNIDDIKNALLGTVFADGSIGKQRTDGSRNGTNADFEVTHTSKNLDYLRIIKDLLERVDGVKAKITEYNKKTDVKTYTLYRLSTNRHEWFTKLRNDLYDDDRVKRFPREYIDKFNLLSLLFLYLDDGTLRVRMYEGTSRVREVRVTFCLDSFTVDELEYFRTYLKSRYDLDTKIYRHTKTMAVDRGFRIWMNSTNTKRFMELIDEFYDLVPSMQYKFTRYYSL